MSQARERVVGQIVITRCLTLDGDLVDYVTTDAHEKDDIPLVEALGMLRLAEDTIIRTRMDADRD